MRHSLHAFAILLLVASFPPRAHAAGEILFQGFLTDDTGAFIDGPISVVARVFPDESSDELLYEELHANASALEGWVELRLGTGQQTGNGLLTSLEEATIESPLLTLELEIDGVVLEPRRSFGSAAYALHAAITIAAKTLGGDPISSFQRFVNGACPAGEAVRSVDAAGGVSCEFDDGTTYSAGVGLDLQGTTLSVDFGVVQARVGAVCPEGEGLQSVALDGTPTCVADRDEDTTYTAGSGLALADGVLGADPQVLQRRVTPGCAAANAIGAVAESGQPDCRFVGSGDITGVLTGPGSGMAGGSASGTANPRVDFTVGQARGSPSCPSGQGLSWLFQDGQAACEPLLAGTIVSAQTAVGSGLDGGCGSGTCALSIDDAETQRRLGSCASGSAIRSVGPTGSVQCENLRDGDIDAVSTPSGSGLDGGCTSGTCQISAVPSDFFVPPEIGYSSGSVLLDRSASTNVVLRQRTITAPSGVPGRIVALASADARCGGGNCGLAGMWTRLATSLTDGGIAETGFRYLDFDTPDSGKLRTLVLSDTFNISAGQTLTIYWRAMASSTGSNVDVQRPRLLIYFVPR